MTEALQKTLAPKVYALFDGSSALVMGVRESPAAYACLLGDPRFHAFEKIVIAFGLYALELANEFDFLGPKLTEADLLYLRFVVKELAHAKRK
jgi:hypothetical protein